MDVFGVVLAAPGSVDFEERARADEIEPVVPNDRAETKVEHAGYAQLVIDHDVAGEIVAVDQTWLYITERPNATPEVLVCRGDVRRVTTHGFHRTRVLNVGPREDVLGPGRPAKRVVPQQLSEPRTLEPNLTQRQGGVRETAQRALAVWPGELGQSHVERSPGDARLDRVSHISYMAMIEMARDGEGQTERGQLPTELASSNVVVDVGLDDSQDAFAIERVDARFPRRSDVLFGS